MPFCVTLEQLEVSGQSVVGLQVSSMRQAANFEGVKESIGVGDILETFYIITQ
jgi:hypothetical protein